MAEPVSAGFLPLLIGLLGAAGGHVAFKLYFRERRTSFLGLAALSFALGQLGFFLALRNLGIGTVYMATGLVQVLVLFVSHQVLNDRISRERLLAVGTVVLGVAIYNV